VGRGRPQRTESDKPTTEILTLGDLEAKLRASAGTSRRATGTTTTRSRACSPTSAHARMSRRC
jgi:hypothetical protein